MDQKYNVEKPNVENKYDNHKYLEFKKLYDDVEQTKRAFNEWLKAREIKLIENNQKVAPHTGWDW